MNFGYFEMLTDDDLTDIEKRCNKATPGPWISYVEARDHIVGSDFIQTNGKDIYLTGASVEDQDFIANARQDVPMLIEEIRRLRAMQSQGKRLCAR